GEHVRLVQPPRLLVEPARRAKVREAKLAARILDAVAQHVERPAPRDLGGEALEKLLSHRRAVVLRELLPFLRLRGEDEVDDVARQQAERAVVVLRPALAVTARRVLAVRRRSFADRRRVARASVGAVLQQGALYRLLESALGDVDRHGLLVPSFSRARSPSSTKSRSRRLPVSSRAIPISVRRRIAEDA